jgi:hypothetical protein
MNNSYLDKDDFVRLDNWESINFFSQKSLVILHEKNALLALKQ